MGERRSGPHGGGVMSRRDRRRFSTWLREAQVREGITGRELAYRAGVDESMVTHIKGGGGAGRAVVRDLGRALHREDEALLMAGFAPEGLLEALAGAPQDCMDGEVVSVLLAVADLDDDDRRKALEALRVLVAIVAQQGREAA